MKAKNICVPWLPVSGVVPQQKSGRRPAGPWIKTFLWTVLVIISTILQWHSCLLRCRCLKTTKFIQEIQNHRNLAISHYFRAKNESFMLYEWATIFFVEHFNCMQRRQWYENVQERKIQIGLTKIRLPVMINTTNKWPESPVVASSVVAVVSCLAVWSLITRSWSHFIISIYLPSRAAIMTAGVRAGRSGGRSWGRVARLSHAASQWMQACTRCLTMVTFP